MNIVYIAFGSNIGDRFTAVEEATSLLTQRGISIIKKSSIIETEPYGYVDQPSFINGVLIGETTLDCKSTLECLLKIEKDIGRVRLFKWGPRIIDLDIIFFNDEIYNEKDLIVPHQDMHNREFVLKPLTEICPEYLHPVFKKTVKQLYEELISHK